MSIIDGPAIDKSTDCDVLVPHPSKNSRIVRFENEISRPETIHVDAGTDSVSGHEVFLLSNYFGIWRFNSRQQFRMQMVRVFFTRSDFVPTSSAFQVHDAALLHHRVGRYNVILRSLIGQMRSHRTLSMFFTAWAFWSKTISAAKSRSVNRMKKSCAIVFATWRIATLWRIHIDAEMARAFCERPCRSRDYGFGDLPSKVSSAAESVVSIMIQRPLSWPNVSTIKRAMNHQRVLLFSLLGDVCPIACHSPGLVKQTLHSLFKKLRSACVVSEAFCSWRCHVMQVASRLSQKETELLDGGVSDVIAGTCVSLGRSNPLLLGYCAMKVMIPFLF